MLSLVLPPRDKGPPAPQSPGAAPGASGLRSAAPSPRSPPGSLPHLPQVSHECHLVTGASPHNPVKNPDPPRLVPPCRPDVPLGSFPIALSTVRGGPQTLHSCSLWCLRPALWLHILPAAMECSGQPRGLRTSILVSHK